MWWYYISTTIVKRKELTKNKYKKKIKSIKTIKYEKEGFNNCHTICVYSTMLSNLYSFYKKLKRRFLILF